MNKEQLIEWAAEQIEGYANLCKGRKLAKASTPMTAKDVAEFILLGHGLAMINPENDWKVNPFEEKWLKSYGGDIDHYRDLMDGYNRCREYIIPLEEVE